MIGGWLYGPTGAIVATELIGAVATAILEVREASPHEIASWSDSTLDESVSGVLGGE